MPYRSAPNSNLMLEPAALARPVPLPWGGEMPLGEFLERYPVEILVHTWDLAEATGQAAVLDRAWCAMRWRRRGSLLPWAGRLAWSAPNAPWPGTSAIRSAIAWLTWVFRLSHTTTS